MDPVEAPLNFAHQQHRKSECYLQRGRIKEAILGHQRAVEFLEKAIQNTQSVKGRESLELQLAFHRRQQQVIKVQEQRLQEWQNNNNLVSSMEETSETSPSNQELHSILKVLDEHDSLLQGLNHRRDNQMTQSDITGLANNNNNLLLKKPTDKETIIEELRLANQELRKLVTGLHSKLETEKLKNRELAELVKEQAKTIHDLKSRKPALSEFASPYGFSPLCELSPGGGITDLPPLAPLEIPKFVYEKFPKDTTDSQSEQ